MISQPAAGLKVHSKHAGSIGATVALNDLIIKKHSMILLLWIWMPHQMSTQMNQKIHMNMRAKLTHKAVDHSIHGACQMQAI
jgi:hypothetical protein